MKATRTMLNGYWDFQPVYSGEPGDHIEPRTVPEQGWLDGGILVPSSWNFDNAGESAAENPDKPWLGFRIGDNFGYPPEWSKATSAWYKRSFIMPALAEGQRWELRFGAVFADSYVFINKKMVHRNTDRTLPFAVELSGHLVEGCNEIAVFCTVQERDSHGKFIQMEGGPLYRGIISDVWLSAHPEVYIDDLTIVTSTRHNTLTATAAIINRSAEAVEETLSFSVDDGSQGQLFFQSGPVRVPAGGTATVKAETEWKTYSPWSPTCPKLYWLEASLRGSGHVARERFGFREFWIEGHKFMLNGTVTNLSGDWGHKISLDFMRPEYLRQWFAMIKDLNMNYTRLHTYPHPEIVLDVADEMGILVCHESAWFFGEKQALGNPVFAENLKDHARRIVKSFKNHPSIVMWSTGNETRWSGDLNSTMKLGPVLGETYRSQDQTRPVYHEGDSSLWDESKQEIISRHYGVECIGEDWWDKSRPLHVGEMGRQHYCQPVENLIFGDDTVYSSYKSCSEAVAREAADIMEQARANEVACLFPWNVSCLDNYRPVTEEKRLSWPDCSQPGLKPLRVPPFGPEFDWTNSGAKGYLPGPAFAIYQRALRKVAVVVRQKQSSIYEDAPLEHTVTVVNDSGADIDGTLDIYIETAACSTRQESRPIHVGAGLTTKIDFSLKLQSVSAKTAVKIVSEFRTGCAVLDRNERVLQVYPAGLPAGQAAFGWNIYVVGDGSLREFFYKHCIAVCYANALADIPTEDNCIVIVEKNTVQAGSTQNAEIRAMMERGVRILVMEQYASIFPGLAMDAVPIERFHIRSGDTTVFEGLTEAETGYWGTSPYGKRQSNAIVADMMYKKPFAGSYKVLADGGKGDFGFGGLQWTPCLEYRWGTGTLIASQLAITGNVLKIPAADVLLLNMIRYLSLYRCCEKPAVVVANDDGTVEKAMRLIGVKTSAHGTISGKGVILLNAAVPVAAPLAAELKRFVSGGGTLLITGVDAQSIDAVNEIAGLDLKMSSLRDAYSLVRKSNDCSILDGISHHETFWYNKIQYGPLDTVNNVIASALLEADGCEVEELLTTERETCWKEFYIHGALTEIYRMPTITYYLQNGMRPYASALLRCKQGSGQVVLCQIELPSPDNYKSRNLWSALMNNIGVAMEYDLLQGERVAAGSVHSQGYTHEIAYLLNPTDGTLQNIIETSVSSEYRILNQKIIDGFGWQRCPYDDNGIAFPFANGQREPGCVVIMFQVNPGRNRKLIATEGGLPNPDLQTFADFEGDGDITLWVNAREYETVRVAPGATATVAGVDLDMNWNTCILLYRPAGGDRPFKCRWRNIQRRPEVEFKFFCTFGEPW